MHNQRSRLLMTRFPLAGFTLLFMSLGVAQVQNHYAGANVTGQMILTRTIVPVQINSQNAALAPKLQSRRTLRSMRETREISDLAVRLSHPLGIRDAASPMAAFRAAAQSASQSLIISPADPGPGFDGVSHDDQRSSDSGNQFSIEPPNPSIAAANGFVLEGVNNAVRIFTTSGSPIMQTISSNQMFGLASSFNRTTGVKGPFLTDMRVYFDQGINRWFVLQRAQDNDATGATLNSSHIYLAVSQSADPRLTWNVYVIDTTDSVNPGCPCLSDFPQIGSDQFGFYISANEYNTTFLELVDTSILAIAKTGLSNGAATPTMERFNIPLSSGYEFALQPATTSPDSNNLIASGGVEYFASTQAFFSSDSNMAIWAMSNTASLQGANPSLLLTQTTAPILTYVYPGVATQRPGPLPYGSSLSPPGQLAFIDGGLDSRVLALTYAGGRLFTTFAAQVTDDDGNSVVGGCYAVVSATFRGAALNATVLKNGYLSVRGNHLLRPGISVNSKGQGAIAVTLTGPSYFPTAAFIPIDFSSCAAASWNCAPPSTLRIAQNGAFPEDGFTGYFPQATAPVARWGDYSTSVMSPDGVIWMVTEYIPNLPRTQLANWGTFIAQYTP
jgi:hypothetical protein